MILSPLSPIFSIALHAHMHWKDWGAYVDDHRYFVWSLHMNTVGKLWHPSYNTVEVDFTRHTCTHHTAAHSQSLGWWHIVECNQHWGLVVHWSLKVGYWCLFQDFWTHSHHWEEDTWLYFECHPKTEQVAKRIRYFIIGGISCLFACLVQNLIKHDYLPPFFFKS